MWIQGEQFFELVDDDDDLRVSLPPSRDEGQSDVGFFEAKQLPHRFRVSGKLGKFYTEVCFEDQLYVRDPDGKTSVGAWLKKLDSGITIDTFVRLQVGEGLDASA